MKVRMDEVGLDLGCQAEVLWETVGRLVNTRTSALLLPCPEWERVAMLRSPAPKDLERTPLRLDSPILQWLEAVQASFVRWRDIIVLPQFQAVSVQEQRLFEELGAEVLVPMRVDGALSGLLVLGAAVDGRAYPRMMLELVAALAQAAARSVENARIFAVQQTTLEELRLSNEAKSEYILAISHQLKTPIAAVKASAEMFMDSQEDALSLRNRLAAAMARGADSLDGLVTELTEYGKMRYATLELHRVETNLGSIVTDACALLQPLADAKGLRLHVEVPSALPPVVVDPHRVEQVLTNLVSNAIKFTPSGGEIWVRVRGERGRLLTQVQDSGPGIPESQQRWLFEAFHGGSDTASRPHVGGLGLAIAKALTELHGGTIWVESQDGQGSTFSFTLPLGPGEEGRQ